MTDAIKPNPLFENSSYVMDYEQLSVVLRIPRRTLERLVENNGIPYRKAGHAVRFYWPAIEEWLRGDAKPKKARS